MANKTLRFYGNGYSHEGNASITVTFNSSTVFTGEVPTLDLDIALPSPDDQQVLFQFDVDENLFGTFPMTIVASNCDFVVSGHAESSNFQNDPLAYYMLTGVGGLLDNRSNVTIDGVAQSKGSIEEILPGPWHWRIPSGSTLSYDILVLPFNEIHPPA